ncbi:MAG TPA: hypothetical protein VIG45_01390 [Erysipelothrix sp.]
MSFEDFKKYHNANYHDGDSHFDERTYQKTNGDDFDCDFVQACFDHFEAGAASRQGEVDALNALGEMSEQKIDDLALRNIELQKRIDSALEKCYTGIRKQGGDYYLELVEEILKGQNNG